MVIHPTSCKLSHSNTFYSHTDSDTRFKFLCEIFNKLPFLLKGIHQFRKSQITKKCFHFQETLRNFSKTWTPSLLYSILSVECEKLQLGRTANSILHRMHASIKDTLFPLVVLVTRGICSNFSLEAIAAIEDDQDKQELLRLIIKTFVPPPLSNILNQNLDNVVTVYSQFPFPSQTILYDMLSEQLLTSLRMATYESENNKVVRMKFESLVKSTPISPAVNFINEHPKLLHSFKHDFIVRTLQLPQMKESWIDLFISFLDRLDCGSDVLSLYLSIHLHDKLLASLGVLLQPLLYLKDPEDFIESMKRRFGCFDFDQNVIGKISTDVLELS